MFVPKMRTLAIACGCAVAVLAMPALSSAGIFSCMSCSAPYAAPVYAAPVYAAPVATPGCASCVTQTAGYMPTVVYRALYQPMPVTSYRPVYQPVAGYSTSGYTAVTTYRPFFGTYETRMVPYATYRPVYAAVPAVAYMGCNSCASYSPCSSCSSCGSGGCGTVTYGAPTSGCASCAAPATVVTPAPYTGNSEAAPATNAPPQKTFQEKVEKPSTDTELKPIPRTDGQLNSMPAPVLTDPSNRTASRSDYSSARVALTSATLQVPPAQINDGWQPARD